MVKYGKFKGAIMTQKITITLEESIVEELSNVAMQSGKKKTQVVREALQDYFDTVAVTQTVQEYKMGTLKTISHEDARKALGL